MSRMFPSLLKCYGIVIRNWLENVTWLIIWMIQADVGLSSWYSRQIFWSRRTKAESMGQNSLDPPNYLSNMKLHVKCKYNWVFLIWHKTAGRSWINSWIQVMYTQNYTKFQKMKKTNQPYKKFCTTKCYEKNNFNICHKPLVNSKRALNFFFLTPKALEVISLTISTYI